MTRDAVNGRNGSGARSGARTLDLLAAPLTAPILRALGEGPKRQAELRHEVGLPAQTTLRTQLKKLSEPGAVVKRRRNRFPGVLEYELSDAGRDLLPVTGTLDRWLDRAPEGPGELGSPPARAAVKALTEGWSTAMLRALAAQPLTLTELDDLIAALNYPSVERRLAAMRVAGLVEAREGGGRGTPYEVTAWARGGVAPVAAAVRWELRHAPAETAPVGKLDVETAFLLVADLLSLPTGMSGRCRLTVELPRENGNMRTGILLSIRGGRLTVTTTKLEQHVDTWVTGPLRAWLSAAIDGDLAHLTLGGEGPLARSLLGALHSSLFPLATRD